jgi:membrane-associated phospholipid phosphatase
VFAALLLAGWLIGRRSGDLTTLAAALWAPLGALVAVAINQVIVTLIAEPRPYAVLPNIVVLVHRTSDPSFPSDHAVLAAVMMAFARVYIGAHYTHDVLVGLALGAAVSWIGWWVARPVLMRFVRRAEDVRFLRPLLTAGPQERGTL